MAIEEPRSRSFDYAEVRFAQDDKFVIDLNGKGLAREKDDAA
jgi:hypothetical protein